MTETDRLLANARAHAERLAATDPGRQLPAPPALGVAVVACMDARVNPFEILGLGIGDAHVIRNAGGLVDDDVMRSLVVSQRFLGTTEIILIHHTSCGMQGLDDEELARRLETETGRRPTWRAGGFADAAEDTRQAIARIRQDPFLLERSSVRGFVYDVDTGDLEEIHP